MDFQGNLCHGAPLPRTHFPRRGHHFPVWGKSVGDSVFPCPLPSKVRAGVLSYVHAGQIRVRDRREEPFRRLVCRFYGAVGEIYGSVIPESTGGRIPPVRSFFGSRVWGCSLHRERGRILRIRSFTSDFPPGMTGPSSPPSPPAQPADMVR